MHRILPEILHIVVRVFSIVQKHRESVFEDDIIPPNDRILDHIHREYPE